MLLCFPHKQKNSNRYWKRAMNLSLPLLLAIKMEKNIEKLLVLIIICLVIYVVLAAWFLRSSNELDGLKPILYICLLIYLSLYYKSTPPWTDRTINKKTTKMKKKSINMHKFKKFSSIL